MYENDHVEIAKYYHMSISQTTLINLGGTFLLLLTNLTNCGTSKQGKGETPSKFKSIGCPSVR